MTGSHSIFLKICPACAAQVPTASPQCGCGHDFESSTTAALLPEEQALRDEELYENYLIARAEQAQQAARAAQDALMDDPEDGNKAAEAELAREVAKSIETDLAEQRAKVEALRRTVDAKRPKPVIPVHTPIIVPASAPSATPKPVSVVHDFTSVRMDPVPHQVAATETTHPEVSVIAIPASEPSSTAPATASSAASPAVSARKAASVLNAIKQAKAREAAAQTRKSRKTASKKVAAPVEAPEAPSRIEVTTVPPPVFRQEQSARAEQVMETRKHVDGKDCPNCTATVPVNTTRCGCGYAFISGGSDLPSLTLCTGDFTALRNSLNLHLRRR